MFYSVPSKALDLILDKLQLKMEPKKFKSGSVGWFLGGKEMIDGVRVQLSFSAVIVGSKPPAELIDVRTVEDILPPDLYERHTSPEKPSEPKTTRKPRKGKKTP